MVLIGGESVREDGSWPWEVRSFCFLWFGRWFCERRSFDYFLKFAPPTFFSLRKRVLKDRQTESALYCTRQSTLHSTSVG